MQYSNLSCGMKPNNTGIEKRTSAPNPEGSTKGLPMDGCLSGRLWTYRKLNALACAKEDTKDNTDKALGAEEVPWVSGLHPLLKKLIARRGMYRGDGTETALADFLFPKKHHSSPPLQVADLAKGVEVLKNALAKGQHIRLYGDYDADGVCAVALLYRLLEEKSKELSYVMANRFEGGYGLSLEAVETAKKDGVGLLVVMDCGTSDFQALAQAKAYGLKVVVCDHHMVGPRLPEADALLNPKRADCGYDAGELSATGVGFKLMQGLALSGILDEERVWQEVGLVALSLISDQIPLQQEARLFTQEGLRCLNQGLPQGLAALIRLMNLSAEPLDSHNLAFKIVPPLNAAGRMKDAALAVRLFIAKDEGSAHDVAQALWEVNELRKETQEKASQEALGMLDADTETKAYAFLYNAHWHPGILGIIAARCVEHNRVPVLVMAGEGEGVVGSMRSYGGIDAYAVLCDCKEHLVSFGGHKQAAGCSLHKSQLEAFHQCFAAAILRQHTHNTSRPEPALLSIDASLDLSQINASLYEAVHALAPYGNGNPEPVFCSHNIQATHIRLLGNKDTLAFKAKHPTSGYAIDAIGFRLNKKIADCLAQGHLFHIVYHLRQNYWREEKSLQLHVIDLKLD